MAKKLTPYEKNKLEWEKRDSILDAILLAYTKNIMHDYPLPGHNRIRERVQKFMKTAEGKKMPKKLQDKIWEATSAPHDEYSVLETHLIHGGHQFGSEFFYGSGTFYRWRRGERAKAQARVRKYFTEEERKYLAKMQRYLRKPYA